MRSRLPWVAAVIVVTFVVAVAFELLSDGPSPPNSAAPIMTPGPAMSSDFDAAHPANQPFLAPAWLSRDQRRAVDAVTALAFTGAQTTVVSVELEDYRTAACGLTGYAVPDRQVWMVWFRGPFRAIVGSHGLAVSPSAVPAKMYLVDAETFVSQQSFAPWPLVRDQAANCPSD